MIKQSSIEKKSKATVTFLFLVSLSVVVSGDEYHPNFAKNSKKEARSAEEDKVEGKWTKIIPTTVATSD